MKKETILKIENCNSLKEYLKVLQDNFDTVKCMPSQMIKQVLITTLLRKVPPQHMIGLEHVRLSCLNSKNLNEFIEIILKSFTLNQNLHKEGKSELVKSTDQIIILTRLKEKGEASKTDPVQTETLLEKTKGIFKRNKKN